ncbi:MAG: apolipoprotein N-acyltransferase [Thermodesulfobacteriota bacterium]
MSGLLLSLAFPTFDLWPLVLVGLSLLALELRGRGLREAFWRGFIAGAAHAGTLLYWLVYTLVTFGQLPWVVALPTFCLLIAYLALYPGLFGLGLALLDEKGLGLAPDGPAYCLLGAALFTGLEYFKGFFLTGFPWEPLGAALLKSDLLIQLADVVGTGGLTFLVVLINLFLAAAVLRMKAAGWAAAWKPAAAAVLILALLSAYGGFRLREIRSLMSQSQTRTVAVIQGSIDQSIKWDPNNRVNTLLTYKDLTLRASAANPWLNIWPETAAPFYFQRDPAASDWLIDLTRKSGAALLFGAPAFEESEAKRRYYNRAYLLDNQGQVLGHYDKTHLVPYGEYVPLQKYFPFIQKITQATGDFYPGPAGKVLKLNDRNLGVLICYESIFPELARRSVYGGADYLVVITNDAWFGSTSAPYQHYDQAAVRAIENRRAVLRAANTGVSGLILPTGRSESSLGLFVPGFLTGRAPRLTVNTIYTAVGDLVPQACLGVTVAVLAAALIRRRYAGRS